MKAVNGKTMAITSKNMPGEVIQTVLKLSLKDLSTDYINWLETLDFLNL